MNGIALLRANMRDLLWKKKVVMTLRLLMQWKDGILTKMIKTKILQHQTVKVNLQKEALKEKELMLQKQRLTALEC